MILNELQKAIILGSSIRIKTDIGFIEIYKGEILNAEKNDGTYGLNALLDILNKSNNYDLDFLDEMPITTITEGWEEIKNFIFNDEKLFFKNFKLQQNEIFKFLDWLKSKSFSGIIISLDTIEVIKEGNIYYSFGVFKENREFDVYRISEAYIDIFLKSIGDLKEENYSKISDIRKQFAIEGSSGIILSYEKLEIFENGLRVLNITDNLPINPEKLLYGFKQENVQLKATPFLTDKDLKVLSYILENSLKLLQEKVGKDAVEKAIEKHKPDVQNPQSVINCIKEVMDKAKMIGGTGWIKKNIHKISDGVGEIANEDLKKLLNELFKV